MPPHTTQARTRVLPVIQSFQRFARLHKRKLITDDDVAQNLSQDHTGFGVWFGSAFHDKESEQFVARYIEHAPLSIEKLSIQDDIETYTTKEG